MVQTKLFFENFLPTGGGRMAAGIHEGVTLLRISDGEGFHQIEFGKDGSTIEKRLYDPKTTIQREGETVSASIERAENENARLILELLLIGVGQDVVQALGSLAYGEFITTAKRLLNDKNIKVNLKVLPPMKEGGFPNIAKFGAVEAYVEGRQPRLKYSAWETKNYFKETNESASDMPII